MEGSLPDMADQGETQVAPPLEEELAAAVVDQAAQVVGQEMTAVVIDEVLDGGRNVLDLAHLARRYGLSEERMERIVNNGIFPLPILKINGVTPVWLATEADDWDAHRFGGSTRVRF